MPNFGNGTTSDFAVTKDFAFVLTKVGTIGCAKLDTKSPLTFFETKQQQDNCKEDSEMDSVLSADEVIGNVTKISAGDGFAVGATTENQLVIVEASKESKELRLSLLSLEKCHKILAFVASNSFCFALMEIPEGDAIAKFALEEDKKMPATEDESD